MSTNIDIDKIQFNETHEIGSGSHSKILLINDTLVFKNMNDDHDMDDPNYEITDNFVREISILSTLKNEPHIISMNQVILTPRNIGYTMKKYNNTLNDMITGFNINNLKQVIYQLLQAVNSAHNKFIVHRDIKPANILATGIIVNKDFELVLCDWSLGRHEYSDNTLTKKEEIQTKWYRAPEVLICDDQFNKLSKNTTLHSFNYKVDIWSIGVIMLELILKKKGVFNSNDSHIVLKKIIKIIGPPSITEWAIGWNYMQKYGLIHTNGTTTENIPLQNLTKIMRKYISDEGIDLLLQMLKYNPIDRIDATQAIRHPYFTTYKPRIIPFANNFYKIESLESTKYNYDNIMKHNKWMTEKIFDDIINRILYVGHKLQFTIIENFIIVRSLLKFLSDYGIMEEQLPFYTIGLIGLVSKLYLEKLPPIINTMNDFGIPVRKDEKQILDNMLEVDKNTAISKGYYTILSDITNQEEKYYTKKQCYKIFSSYEKRIFRYLDYKINIKSSGMYVNIANTYTQYDSKLFSIFSFIVCAAQFDIQFPNITDEQLFGSAFELIKTSKNAEHISNSLEILDSIIPQTYRTNNIEILDKLKLNCNQNIDEINKKCRTINKYHVDITKEDFN